jgi:hypothetical protein
MVVKFISVRNKINVIKMFKTLKGKGYRNFVKSEILDFIEMGISLPVLQKNGEYKGRKLLVEDGQLYLTNFKKEVPCLYVMIDEDCAYLESRHGKEKIKIKVYKNNPRTHGPTRFPT